MKVTKLIREYVEKKVFETYPKSEAELIWEEKSRRANEALTRANDVVEAYAKKVAEEFNTKFGLSEDYRLKAFDGRNYFSITSYRDCSEYQAKCKAEDARGRKIRETIEDILITLEMGGTRADLDVMLTKIGQGE